MLIPLFVLAGCAVLVGLAFGPTGWFAGHLSTTPGLAEEGAEPGFSFSVALLGTLAGLAGVGLSYMMYGKESRQPELTASQFRPVYLASLNKLWVDEFYDWLIVKPTRFLAAVSQFVDDYLVHGLFVRGLAWVPRLLGRDVLAPIQNGLLQFYAATTALALAVLFLILVFQ